MTNQPLDKKIRNYNCRFKKGQEFIIFKEDVKSSLSNLKKRLKKSVRDAYSCCDCEDHMKWDRLMDSLFKDMDKIFIDEFGEGLL